MQKNKITQKVRFAIVGGLNTAIDFGIFFTLSNVGVNPLIANYASTTTALTFSFFANKKYTFQGVSSSNLKREIVLFLVFTLIGLWVLQPGVIFLLQRGLHNSGLHHNVVLLIAKLCATAISLVWNYITYSKFVFVELHGANTQ